MAACQISRSRSLLSTSKKGKRKREYLIRRAALGDYPTQEQMRVVVAYGSEQNRINFPQLY